MNVSQFRTTPEGYFTSRWGLPEYTDWIDDATSTAVDSFNFQVAGPHALAVIDIDHAEIGGELSVVWGNPGERQIAIRAKVAPAPYKQDNRRVDLHSLR